MTWLAQAVTRSWRGQTGHSPDRPPGAVRTSKTRKGRSVSMGKCPPARSPAAARGRVDGGPGPGGEDVPVGAGQREQVRADRPGRRLPRSVATTFLLQDLAS